MSTAPTFLLCTERSGSNLIRLLVGTHSEIHAPPPIHLGRDVWRRLPLYGDLGDDRSWRLVLSHVVRAHEEAVLGLGVPFDVAELLREVPTRSFGDVYAYVHDKARRAAGKGRLFLKENHAHRYAQLLLGRFPGARFVFQVRDPRDYLAACLAVGGKYGSVLGAVDAWQDDQLGSLRILHQLGPDRVFVQRYEDLVTAPEVVLRALCRFLGVGFEAGMLEFYRREEARRGVRAWSNWHLQDQPITTARVRRHERELGRSERLAVERRLAPLMTLFGYEPSGEEPTPTELALARASGALPRPRRREQPRRAENEIRRRAARVEFRKKTIPREIVELGARLRLPY